MVRKLEKLRGTLLRDFELRYTPTGKAVASSLLETAAGNCFGIVIWEEAAERVVLKLKKGDMATFQGKHKIRRWTDRNGNDQNAQEFHCN